MSHFSIEIAGAVLTMAGLAGAFPAAAQPTDDAPITSEAAETWPEAWFEIFKLAPGKSQEFIRRVAWSDEVSAAAGLPPKQFFSHQAGADFDVILFKLVHRKEISPAQEAAMAAKRRELGLRSRPAYFHGIRELIAEHSDSKTVGPDSASRWLARLDLWRAGSSSRATVEK